MQSRLPFLQPVVALASFQPDRSIKRQTESLTHVRRLAVLHHTIEFRRNKLMQCQTHLDSPITTSVAAAPSPFEFRLERFSTRTYSSSRSRASLAGGYVGSEIVEVSGRARTVVIRRRRETLRDRVTALENLLAVCIMRVVR
jgi:hypothetical protein